jgi:hypothetical protein
MVRNQIKAKVDKNKTKNEEFSLEVIIPSFLHLKGFDFRPIEEIL